MNRIEEIKERLSKATRGPWAYDDDRTDGDYCIHVKGAVPDTNPSLIRDADGVVGSSEWIYLRYEDAEFIANSRSDVEFLLNEISALQDRVLNLALEHKPGFTHEQYQNET